VDKARKASVTRDVIERAIKKGAGVGDEQLVMEQSYSKVTRRTKCLIVEV